VQASDVQQSVFLRFYRWIFKRKDAVKDTPHAERLLWRIAKHVIQNAAKVARWPKPMLNGDPRTLGPVHEESLVLRDEVQFLLAALKPSEVQIVSLWLENYRAAEIADLVGCCRQTVRRVLKRVIKRMQERRGKYSAD
jgi:DNA-directed RNA polymerase specialized sigma24 family protein